MRNRRSQPSLLTGDTTGGDLTLHELPTFSLLSSFAAQSRGVASLFDLSTYIHQPPAPTKKGTSRSAAPEVRTTVALACRRRLVLLSWIDGAWQTPSEVALPHQIRGMAFDQRKIVAGFSTGDYGIITLPAVKPAPGEVPTLGELFSPTLPAMEKVKASASSLGGLGNVMGLSSLGGLSIGAKKLEKNGVVSIPRAGKGKGKAEGKTQDPRAWLWGKEWGWEDEELAKEGEVLAVRESKPLSSLSASQLGLIFDHRTDIAIPLTSSGKTRTSTPSFIVYPSLVDETLVLSPYIVSLLAAPAPPPPGTSATAPQHPALAIHSIDTLSPVQTLQVPPRPISPPSSLSEGSDPEQPNAAPLSARFLTVACTASQPPLLILTSSTGAPTPVDQTLWIGRMKSWQAQIEELGATGAWEEGVRLVRRSGASGGADLPVGSAFVPPLRS